MELCSSSLYYFVASSLAGLYFLQFPIGDFFKLPVSMSCFIFGLYLGYFWRFLQIPSVNAVYAVNSLLTWEFVEQQ